MTQWCYHKASRSRSGTHWQKWRPVYLVAAATVLSLLQPLAVLFIYVGEVGYPGSKMWHSGSWFPNTAHGIILYLAKWVGMILMLVGVLQITQLRTKIMARWRQIRYGAEAEEEGQRDVVIGTTADQKSAPRSGG